MPARTSSQSAKLPSSVSAILIRISEWAEGRMDDFESMEPASALYDFSKPLWKVDLLDAEDALKDQWFFWDVDIWSGLGGTLAECQREILEWHLYRRKWSGGRLLTFAGLRPEAADPTAPASRIELLRAPTRRELREACLEPPAGYGTSPYFICNDLLRARRFLGKPISKG